MAPITAVIVLLVPEMTHTSAIASALDRILEVAVGGVTGLLVSLLFFPSKAHALVADTAGRTLDQMARALRELLGGFTRGFDFDSLHSIQDGIGQALLQLQAVGSEAERERSARLAFGPETEPLLRTLFRLRHDLVIVGRAARSAPLEVSAPVGVRSAEVAAAFGEYLSASGAALLARRPPPSLSAAESALSAHAAEVAALHREWAAENVPGETAECLSALGFALQQIYENFRDSRAARG